LQPEENNPTLKIKASMAMVSVADVKQLQANTIHKQNNATTKIKLMDQSMVAPREKGKKPIIIINAKGCPLVPSWNQWFSTLK
jgi:hypothetical protein